MTAATTRGAHADLPVGRSGSPRRPWDAAAIGLLTLGVGLLLSWRPAYWRDEIATLNAARKPWSELYDLLGSIDAVHGLYYSFMHVWVGLAGTDPFVTRLPSAIACGMAGAAVTLLAATYLGRAASLFAGVTFAALPIVTAVAFEARGMAFALACVSWGAVVFEAARRGRRRAWAWYGLLYLLAIGFFLQTATILVAHLVVLLWVRADRRVVRDWAISVGLILVVAAPLILLARSQAVQVAWLPRPAPSILPASVGLDQWFGGDVRLAAAGLALLLIAVMLPPFTARAYGPQFAQFRALTVTWVLVPIGCVLAVTYLFTPMYSPRYLFFTAPAVALLVGAALGALRPRWVGLIALVVLLLLSVRPALTERGEFAKTGTDFSAAAAAVTAGARPGDAVVFAPDTGSEYDPRLVIDAYPQDFAGLVDAGRVASWSDEGLWPHGADLMSVAGSLGGYDRVWLITAPTKYPNEAVAASRVLASSGLSVGSTWVGPWTTVTLFERPDSTA